VDTETSTEVAVSEWAPRNTESNTEIHDSSGINADSSDVSLHDRRWDDQNWTLTFEGEERILGLLVKQSAQTGSYSVLTIRLPTVSLRLSFARKRQYFGAMKTGALCHSCFRNLPRIDWLKSVLTWRSPNSFACVTHPTALWTRPQTVPQALPRLSPGSAFRLCPSFSSHQRPDTKNWNILW